MGEGGKGLEEPEKLRTPGEHAPQKQLKATYIKYIQPEFVMVAQVSFGNLYCFRNYVFSYFSIAVRKHLEQKQLGEEKIFCILETRVCHPGKPRQELGAEAMAKHCSLACSSWLAQPACLRASRTQE